MQSSISLIHCFRRSKMSDSKKSVVFVTGNMGKYNEVNDIFKEKDIKVTSAALDLQELQGERQYISIQKCKLAAQHIKGPVFVEDSSLCFNALGGMPGPYIRWFLQACGTEGSYKLLNAFEDKTGFAETVLSFTTGVDEPVHTFVGTTEGKIVAPRGISKFAGVSWDPIFEPNDGQGKTYAEMTKEQKNSISHRKKALEKLLTFLVENSHLLDEN